MSKNFILLFGIVFCFCISTLSAQNKPQDPFILMDTLKARISRETDIEKKISMIIRLSITFKSVGNYEEGLKKAEEAVSLSVENKSPSLASAYNMVGVFNKDLGNYAEAINIYQKVLRIVKENKDQGGIAGTYTNLANIYANQGKINEALEAFESASKIFQQLGSKNGAAICYNNMGTIYMDQGKHAEALTNFFLAYSLFTITGYKNGMGATYNNIGDIYRNQGNYIESSKYLFQSLKYYEEAKDDAGIGIAHSSIGSLYSDQFNYEEALKYYQSALTIYQKNGDKYGIAGALSNIGFVFLKKKYYDDAMKNFLTAKKIQEELGNKQGLATCLNNIGSILKVQQKHEESLKSLFASLKISEELKDISAMADTYNNIGATYLDYALRSKEPDAKQKYRESLNYYVKGFTQAKIIGAKKLMQDSHEGQALVYENIKDYKKAYEFKSLYAVLKDSLINNESSKKMESLRIQYEVQKVQADEQTKQEKEKTALQFAFLKREDSLKYQQSLTQKQLEQQTLLGKQQEQALLLKQAALEISDQQNELNRLAYLKTQAELQAEQSKRTEKEKQLTLAERDKDLNISKLQLQQAQLNINENQLYAQKKQRLFYIGGLALLILLFFFIYRNIQQKHKNRTLIEAERLNAERARAAHRMAELELQSLRTQLNPHFMFNSLNAIQELILIEDNENSHMYLSRFSELLRMLLDNANQPFIPLKKEVEFLKLYLSLEKLRIPDLEYSFDIDSNTYPADVLIPNMILQPYIENALWHGLAHKKRDKQLQIVIRQESNSLLFKIEDNGVGRKKAVELRSLYRKEHKSKGMELLSKRFALLSKEYGEEIQINVKDKMNGEEATGTLVEIQVPLSLTGKANQLLHDTSNYN